MSDEYVAFSRARHPTQHRGRVGLGMLFYGLFGAPIFWAGNLMVSYALATHACYPGHEPLARIVDGLGFAWPLILGCYVVTLILCVSGFVVAFRSWWISGSESEGHGHHLIEVGEGRTRYLAIIGMAFSILFFLVTLAGALILAIVPLCEHAT
jgi:hypothetical protein